MKEKLSLLIFVAFVATSPMVQAQAGLKSSQFGSAIQKTIIRETASPRSISYVETATDHYFAFSDGSANPMILNNISTAISVNDFYISDDTVFFCGSNIANRAFLGHFEINDFFFGTHSYSYTAFNFFSADNITLIKTFDKMVAFEENGVRKLAVIGYDQNPEPLVAEVLYNVGTGTVTYTVGQLSGSTEEIYDIALTDHYVITAGFRYFSNVIARPSIRVYDRSSMFQAGGPQDTVNCLSKYGSQTVSFDPTQLVMSHLQGDTFAVATYWRHNNSNNDTGVFVSIQRIASSGQVAWVNSLVTTQSFQNGSWQLRGMTAMDYSSHFYLLQSAEVTNVNSNVDLLFTLSPSMFLLAPYGGTMSMAYTDEPMFMSIDAIANTVGLFSNGYTASNPLRMLHYFTTTYSQRCLNHGTQQIYPIDMIVRVSTDAFTVNHNIGITFNNSNAVQSVLGENTECTE